VPKVVPTWGFGNIGTESPVKPSSATIAALYELFLVNNRIAQWPQCSRVKMPRSMGKLHGVPDLPPHHLPHEENLAGLKRKLLAGSANVGVQGMGGTGKTVLAVAMAHDPKVRRAFSDGIYWLTVGQKPNLLGLQNRLLGQ
jgi:hypothetical protein